MDRSSHGFTLIELVIVVAIIVIITTIGIATFSGVIKNAQVSRRKGDKFQTRTALELYNSANSSYPNTLPTPGQALTDGNGINYLRSMSTDPDSSFKYSYIALPTTCTGTSSNSCTSYTLYQGTVNQPVAHWKTDESVWTGTAGEVIDSSGNNNNGTAMGGATTTGGKYGYAGSFNGSGAYIETTNNTSLQVTNGFTLSVWIYPTSVNTYYQIVSKFGTSGNWAYQMGLAPVGNLRTDISGDGATYQGLVTSSSPVATNTWSYVAFTFKSGQVVFYVNGFQIYSLTSSVTSIFNSGNTKVNIGRDPVGIQYFPGLIDDVRIYNYALTQSEIQNVMNGN